MRLRPSTQAKLDRSKKALADEFKSVPPDEIAREVDAIAKTLAERARFDDYIPILAHRFTRDGLRDRSTSEALPEAA
jgi:hypothetical protein